MRPIFSSQEASRSLSLRSSDSIELVSLEQVRGSAGVMRAMQCLEGGERGGSGEARCESQQPIECGLYGKDKSYYNWMELTREPLLAKQASSKQGDPPAKQGNPPAKQYITPRMTPIERYNLVVECYNMPCNIIDSVSLNPIAEPSLYASLYRASISLRGKILFVLLSAVPFLNLITLVISMFYACTYWGSLRVHRQNLSLVADPFKKMTFDPELCYAMGCDYYFFNIELKQLEGFSLNYQQNMSTRLNLRKERGTTSLMVYNANFWASFNYFQKWKLTHYLPFCISLLENILVNLACIWFLTH